MDTKREMLRITVAIVVVLTLGLCACGDDATDADGGAGGRSEAGSAAQAGRDAGGQGGSGGASGGGAAAEQGGGGTAGDLHAGKCQEPRIVDDDDECFTCAAEHCCHLSAGWCLSPSPNQRESGASWCYRDLFQGCIVACYEELASVDTTTDSWDLVAECVRGCEDAHLNFPASTSSGGNLVQCIIGSPKEYSELSDGDAGADDSDGGGERECQVADCLPRSPCAEVCFRGFR